eukprot:506982-Alexandrium_andersonii.AAC.1
MAYRPPTAREDAERSNRVHAHSTAAWQHRPKPSSAAPVATQGRNTRNKMPVGQYGGSLLKKTSVWGKPESRARQQPHVDAWFRRGSEVALGPFWD